MRNRLWREIHQRSMTLLVVEKAQTLVDARQPQAKQRIPLGGSGEQSLAIETQKPYKRRVETVLEYYSALRTITGLYAYCGTHEVDSRVKEGTKVRFFDWGVVLGYADDCMTRVIRINIPEADKLRWLRTRDEATRTEMVELINDGWPGGEALVTADARNAHFWKMKDGTAAAGEVTERSASRKRRRSPSRRRTQQPPNDPRRGRQQQQQLRQRPQADQGANPRAYTHDDKGRPLKRGSKEAGQPLLWGLELRQGLHTE